MAQYWPIAGVGVDTPWSGHVPFDFKFNHRRLVPRIKRRRQMGTTMEEHVECGVGSWFRFRFMRRSCNCCTGRQKTLEEGPGTYLEECRASNTSLSYRLWRRPSITRIKTCSMSPLLSKSD